MFSKQLELSIKEENKLKLCFINNYRVFLYEKKKKQNYLYLPFQIKLKKQRNYLVFSIKNENDKSILISFFNLFTRFLKNNKEYQVKKINLTGLGFRINWLEKGKLLLLKLGYSHLIKIPVPINKIKVIKKKNALLIKGEDPVFIGNFCNKIKQLKYPNVYTGKGFWYKNEKMNLKIFKKK
jgi:ribosomal protein L6P/L9E